MIFSKSHDLFKIAWFIQSHTAVWVGQLLADDMWDPGVDLTLQIETVTLITLYYNSVLFHKTWATWEYGLYLSHSLTHFFHFKNSTLHLVCVQKIFEWFCWMIEQQHLQGLNLNTSPVIRSVTNCFSCFIYLTKLYMAFLVAQTVKNPPAMWET